MFDIQTLHKENDGLFHATDPQTDEDVIITEMFPTEMWDCKEAFDFAGIKGYEPMTAKELDTEEAQLEKLNDPNYIIGESLNEHVP